jgi:hypothetical protein
VAATEYLDAAAEKGKSYYYVVRSVEHSSLASRAFSNEAAINPAPGRRFYFEAEYGQSQEAPFRTTIDPSVVNEKLIQLRLLSDEAKDSIGRITCAAWPSAGTYRLWARVKRGLGSAADCGLTAQAHGEWGLGPKAFMPVASNEWTWKLMPGEVKATKGECLIEFTGFGAGLSLDRFCLTDDAAFTPKGKGSDVEIAAPPAPAGLQAAECRNFDIRLTWTASAAPEFSHYQVYRKRGEGVKAAQEFLVGSPCAAELLDYELRPGETYSYVITAVDDWGNESPASPAIVAKTADLPQRVEKTVALADVEGIDKAAKKLTDAKVQGIYRFDSSDKEKAELRIPFEVEADGSYVIWIHGAAIGDFQTALDYVVDGGTSYVSRYGAREYVQGQAQSERIQWDRLMCIGRDAGTVFPLKAGRHVLIIRNRKGSECSMVLDKILVTNDFSLLPQPNRFRL